MPHTVRPAGRAISPAASIANVMNVGAVKHGRNTSSSSISDPGSLVTRSIGGTPSRSSKGTADASSHSRRDPPPARIERTFPKSAKLKLLSRLSQLGRCLGPGQADGVNFFGGGLAGYPRVKLRGDQ